MKRCVEYKRVKKRCCVFVIFIFFHTRSEKIDKISSSSASKHMNETNDFVVSLSGGAKAFIPSVMFKKSFFTFRIPILIKK